MSNDPNTRDSRASGFDNSQYSLAYPVGIENHFWNSARTSVIESYLKKSHLPKDELKILELGCATGYVVKQLLDAGFDAYGSDISTAPHDKSIEQRLFYGSSAFELPISLRKEITVLLLLDVIEHVENPESLLALCKDSFPNLKLGIVTVPARPELWSNYDDFYGHLRRYTKTTLGTTLASAGWGSNKVRYLFVSLFPVMWFLSRVSKNRSVQVNAPRGIAMAVHRALAFMFRLEHPILGRVLPGTSLISISEFKITGR